MLQWTSQHKWNVALNWVAMSGLMVTSVLASPASTIVVKSSLNPPHGWSKHSLPSPLYNVTLHFALRQSNFAELERELYEISDPGSPRWTHHLEKGAVEKLISPRPETLALVDEYFISHGVDMTSVSRSAAKDWVIITVPVAQAEKLLNTRLHVYKHSESGARLVRTDAYSLPIHLHPHIDSIQPTNHFGRIRAHASSLRTSDCVVLDPSTSSLLSSSDSFNITLQTLKDLYSVGTYIPSTHNANMLGITGYLGQYANMADLRLFFEMFLPQAAGTTPRVVSVNGGINSQNISAAGMEAGLDVQYAGGLSYPIPNIFYTTDGRGPNTQKNLSYADNGNEPYEVFLLNLLARNDSELPRSLTTSYGEDEIDVPEDYAKRVCTLYAQLGVRGVSVLHSSGDYGVGGSNPTRPCSSPMNRFRALFPASCTFVTAVGGTTQIPETAASLSGGGFSDYFARPSYQDRAVSKYLQSLGTQYQGLYNTSGRGIPDVSAQAAQFAVMFQGSIRYVSGTSAAAPTFAGIIALLNDVLLSNGHGSLGFLNPFLYQTGQAGMNDITTGSNPGCGTGGFNATAGWDPVTGVGTPNFGLLRQIVLGNMPSNSSSPITVVPTAWSSTVVGSRTSPTTTSSSAGGKWEASGLHASLGLGLCLLGTLLYRPL